MSIHSIEFWISFVHTMELGLISSTKYHAGYILSYHLMFSTSTSNWIFLLSRHLVYNIYIDTKFLTPFAVKISWIHIDIGRNCIDKLYDNGQCFYSSWVQFHQWLRSATIILDFRRKANSTTIIICLMQLCLNELKTGIRHPELNSRSHFKG